MLVAFVFPRCARHVAFDACGVCFSSLRSSRPLKQFPSVMCLEATWCEEYFVLSSMPFRSAVISLL